MAEMDEVVARTDGGNFASQLRAAARVSDIDLEAGASLRALERFETEPQSVGPVSCPYHNGNGLGGRLRGLHIRGLFDANAQ
jgi:hypothetical protein